MQTEESVLRKKNWDKKLVKQLQRKVEDYSGK